VWNNPSPGKGRVDGRIVLVNALKRCVLLAKVAHVIVGARDGVRLASIGQLSRRHGHSRPPQLAASMSCRVVDGPLQAVQPVAVVKLVRRFRGGIVKQIGVGVFGRPEHGRVLAPPGAQLHLVVAVERSRIKQDGLASPFADAHIPFPQVSMDEAGLDRPASFPEVVEQARNHLPRHLLYGPLVLCPRTIPPDVQVADCEKHVAVEDGPAVLPVHNVGPVAVAGRHMESEPGVGRLACLVQLCQSAGELGRVGGGRDVHVDILGHVKVSARALGFKLAEADRCGDKVGHDAVNDPGGLELAPEHDAARLSKGNLHEMRKPDKDSGPRLHTP